MLDVGEIRHAVEQRLGAASGSAVRAKSTNSAWMSCGGTAVPIRLSHAWVTIAPSFGNIAGKMRVEDDVILG